MHREAFLLELRSQSSALVKAREDESKAIAQLASQSGRQHFRSAHSEAVEELTDGDRCGMAAVASDVRTIE